MLFLVVAFLVSFLVNLFVIRHFNLSAFHDSSSGVQKFHTKPVPRIGGVSIFVSLIAVGILFAVKNKDFSREFLLLVLSSFPVFALGLAEDITKKVSPKWRLLGAIVSGILAVAMLNAVLKGIHVPFVDNLFSFKLFAVAFTVFGIAGVSHAFNIIDGFNGLASGTAIMIFASYSYVSFLLHDYFLLYTSLVLIFATLGFFLWNYPSGSIFLGDSGAYLLGFLIAIEGVLFAVRHPQVSPWFPMLLVVYPVWETLFSAYRRKFIKGVPPHEPDAVHLHTLIYRRLVKFTFGAEPEKRNAMTSPYLWVMELFCVIPAVLFWRKTLFLALFVFAFVVIYTWLYFRIVRFKTPKILKT